MKSRYFFLMGIIFLIVDTQAMNGDKKKNPFIERLEKEQAQWESRQNKNKNNQRAIYDTFELERIKKLKEQKKAD